MRKIQKEAWPGPLDTVVGETEETERLGEQGIPHNTGQTGSELGFLLRAGPRTVDIPPSPYTRLGLESSRRLYGGNTGGRGQIQDKTVMGQDLEVNPNNQGAKWYAQSVGVRRREEICGVC